jgi:hypothetical protein
MRLPNLLTMLAGALILISLIYIQKHPRAKGEPLDRTQRLIMIPLSLSFSLLAIAGFLMFARP